MSMTNAEKIARVQQLLGNEPSATNEVVSDLLDQASDAILGVMYPLGDYGEAVLPTRYYRLQCDLAARYFARMGANGEVVHNENGINRTWHSPDDADLLRKVTPICKVY